MTKELPRIMFMKRRLHWLEEETERRREMETGKLEAEGMRKKG